MQLIARTDVCVIKLSDGEVFRHSGLTDDTAASCHLRTASLCDTAFTMCAVLHSCRGVHLPFVLTYIAALHSYCGVHLSFVLSCIAVLHSCCGVHVSFVLSYIAVVATSQPMLCLISMLVSLAVIIISSITVDTL